MSNPHETGRGVTPEEIEDQALTGELLSLGKIIRQPRYMDYDRVDWNAIREANGLIPGKVIEALRKKGQSRLLDVSVTPNELASQLMVRIIAARPNEPPTFIFVNYPELEAVEPNYRELIEPFIFEPKTTLPGPGSQDTP